MARRNTPPAPAGEKLCTRCEDFWPADGEFFYPDRRAPDGLYYACKACYVEHLTKPCRRQRVLGSGPRLTDGVAPLLVAGGLV